MFLNSYKFSDNSRRLQGKRFLADYDACRAELKNELNLLFLTFQQSVEKVNDVLSGFPPQSRSRTLEASVMQSCFAEALFQNFGEKAFYGKYKRLILRVSGYIILFKKLDKKGLPMNILTTNIQGILQQHKTLDLFSQSSYNEDPILYFGYQKNKFGDLINPQIVYIDEGKIAFRIVLSDSVSNTLVVKPNVIEPNQINVAIRADKGVNKVN